MRKILYWVIDRSLGTYVALLLLLAASGISFAATSWDVHNNPKMYLNAGITTTQTASITIAPPRVNGAVITFPTTSGGILHLQQGTNEEDIYYTSASVNSTTKDITLSGVTRNSCRQYATLIQTCGNGKQFSKGANVTLSDDARLFNLKLNVDRTNTGTGLFMLRSNQTTQPWLFPNAVTTAQADAFTRGKGATDYHIIADTTLGVMKYWNGSAYINFGSGTTVNASELVAGKAEAADFSEVANLDQTGATLALAFLTPRHLVKNGSGSTSANRIPLLNSSGLIPLSMGGNGTGSSVGIASGAILVYQRASAPRALYPAATNQVIVSVDGVTWRAGGLPQDVDTLTGSIADSNSLANPQTPIFFTQTGSLTSTQINAKHKRFTVFAAGTAGWGAGNLKINLKIGSQIIAQCTFLPVGSADWAVTFQGIIRTSGASGVVQVASSGDYSTGVGEKSCSETTNTTSFDTTANKTVNIGADFSASNGSNSAQMKMFFVDSITN